MRKMGKLVEILKTVIVAEIILCGFILPSNYCTALDPPVDHVSTTPGTTTSTITPTDPVLTTLHEVRNNLLQKYDTHESPPTSHGGPTIVTLDMTINHFDLDEAEYIFYVNAWVSVSWMDSRLSWMNDNLTNHNNYLRFGVDEIWKPDVVLYNNAYTPDVDHFGNSVALVKHGNGSVSWKTPARLSVHCTLNLIRWPYDKHECKFVFASSSHAEDEIELRLPQRGIEEYKISYDMWTENSEWYIVKADAAKDDNSYGLTFSFTIQRNSPSYGVCIILPVCIAALVNIAVFLLPPTSGEKITLASINCFIISIFLIYFEAKLPALGDHIPLVVLMCACNLVLVGMSIIISVIVLSLSRTRRASRPPQCFRLFCNVNFAKILGLGHIVPFISQTYSRLDNGVELRSRSECNSASNNSEKEDQISSLMMDYPTVGYPYNAEWILLASMIDRLSFIVYAVVTGIILGLCLS